MKRAAVEKAIIVSVKSPKAARGVTRPTLKTPAWHLVIHPQPVEQCALGLLLAAGDFD
jgi:hypothetical protein